VRSWGRAGQERLPDQDRAKKAPWCAGDRGGRGAGARLGNIDPSPGYSTRDHRDSLAALRRQARPRHDRHGCREHPRSQRAAGRGAVPGFSTPRGIEMACVDLTARELGVPGIAPISAAREGTPELQRLDRPFCRAAEARAEARNWFERGFPLAKIKVGGRHRADGDRVKAVREAVADTMALRIDANAMLRRGHGYTLARRWCHATTCNSSSSRCRQTISPAWRACGARRRRSIMAGRIDSRPASLIG